ncbi:MAG: ribosome biogenesis GTPase Der [Phycisphaerales bacterium]|nr:ribosome biogenesis GTPase Der [Phycisphaerales bacterium]
MPLPVVAIVGRPNVGKSSLFNALAGERISIVDPTPGVTRDRVSTIVEQDDRYFELVDTGGFGIVDRDDLGEHVERQIRFAIDRASLILFVVDVRDGLTALDRETSRLLQRHHERTRLIANKVDDPRLEPQAAEFIRLGFGEPLCVSAAHGAGQSELKEAIREALSALPGEAPGDPVMKIALVGRRNVGKSTFINALAREERVIVSEIPGTTRDSIDVAIEKDGRRIIVIDTAGVRKVGKMIDAVEYYGYDRAVRSIGRADVVLLLIDATSPVGQVDKKLAQLIASEFKPVILVVNKWDLAVDRTSADAFGEYLGKTLPHVNYAPIAFTTAKDSRNVFSTIDLATTLMKQSRRRVATARLNEVLQSALAERAPKAKHGTRLPKLLYATQVAVAPPTIVLFVDRPAAVTASYERFLINRLRENLPFDEAPIRLWFRARTRRVLEPLSRSARESRERRIGKASKRRNAETPKRRKKAAGAGS